MVGAVPTFTEAKVTNQTWITVPLPRNARASAAIVAPMKSATARERSLFHFGKHVGSAPLDAARGRRD